GWAARPRCPVEILRRDGRLAYPLPLKRDVFGTIRQSSSGIVGRRSSAVDVPHALGPWRPAARARFCQFRRSSLSEMRLRTEAFALGAGEERRQALLDTGLRVHVGGGAEAAVEDRFVKTR